MILGPERRGVMLPGAGGAGRRHWTCWAILWGLLVALLAGAATWRPSAAVTGDAATHLMQAVSLARDLDLTYGPEDYERFVADRGAPPEGLRLRSRDAGNHIAFDVPVPYAFALAPVVRFAPVRGPAIANALLLALAALAAARVLERRLGPAAPLWVAAFVFASVTFTYVFRVGPELFALAAVVCAFAAAYRKEGPPARAFTEIYGGALPGEESGRGTGRWILVGALLGLAAACHPFYLLLVLPLALAPPRARPGAGTGRRRVQAAVVVVAALSVPFLAGLVGRAAGDDWNPWSAEGRVFLSETGFPAVDTPVSAWPDDRTAGPEGVAGGPGAAALGWLPGGPPRPVPDAGLWGWNLLFLGLGRAVGVVPYFLPALLIFAGWPGGRSRAGRDSGGGRGAIPWTVAAVLLLFLLVRPFDFAGGAEGPANRWFVPLYGALWFVVARPVRPLWALVAALAAAPYLHPSWLAPRTVASGPELRAGGYVSAVAGRLLPHESSQRDVAGVREVQHGVLRVRLLSPGIGSAPAPAGGDRLSVDAARGGEMLVTSPVALAGLRVAFGPGAPTQVAVAGAALERTTLTAAGGVLLTVGFRDADRVHPLWWTEGDVFLYRLRLEFPAGGEGETFGEGTWIPFELVPLFEEDEESPDEESP